MDLGFSQADLLALIAVIIKHRTFFISDPLLHCVDSVSQLHIFIVELALSALMVLRTL
jgi:hypothetical protein